MPLKTLKQNKAVTNVHQDLIGCWQEDNHFAEIMKTEGAIYREIENRVTLKFSYNGQNYFIKKHYGFSNTELIKNLLVGRLPVMGAGNEVNVLSRLHALDVKVPEVAGFGEKQGLAKQSFIITREVESTTSLDQLASLWKENRISWQTKQSILKKVAWITKTLHQNGINHRDLYACHFMISSLVTAELDITLMDLHRAGIHKKIPTRWVIKDLASLYYSVLNFKLTQRDILRFIQYYSEKSWQVEVIHHASFWAAVKKRTKHFIKRHTKFFDTPNPGKN